MKKKSQHSVNSLGKLYEDRPPGFHMFNLLKMENCALIPSMTLSGSLNEC